MHCEEISVEDLGVLLMMCYHPYLMGLIYMEYWGILLVEKVRKYLEGN